MVDVWVIVLVIVIVLRVVVDCHHIGGSGSGNNVSYHRIGGDGGN